MPVPIDDVLNLIQQQNVWRSECVNLIASENTQSPAVRDAQNNDYICLLARILMYPGCYKPCRRYASKSAALWLLGPVAPHTLPAPH